MFETIVRILLSRKFAVNLLIVMVVFLVIGTSLPDLSSISAEDAQALKAAKPLQFQVADTLQIQKLISSPYFLLLPLLIFASTAICTLKRLSGGNRNEGGVSFEQAVPCKTGIEEVVSLLASLKWSVLRKDGVVMATKGGFGFWGSILFHAGLLLVFVAVSVSAITQFNAELLLTEGYPVTLSPDAFVKIHKKNGMASLPPAVLELKRFVPRYEQDRFATDFSAEILMDGMPKKIQVNSPVETSGFQLSLHRFGFSPSFLITDERGREILNATINLVIVGGKEDSFAIPGTSYVIHTEFFPDFYAEQGRYGSRGILPKNPVFLMRVLSEGRETGRGLVPLGQTVRIGNLTIKSDGLSYWVDLIVGRDYGIWIFTLGFAAGILGLACRFAVPDKHLEVRIEGDKLCLKGWSKYFPAFFEEELKKILNKIASPEYN